jgi:hypothetical protein
MRLKNSYPATPNEVKNRIRTRNREADQAARRSARQNKTTRVEELTEQK